MSRPARAATSRTVTSMSRHLHDIRERAALSLRRLLVGEDIPISTTAHRGDPGLLGPDSVSWMVLADPSTLFGGVRSLLQQACHPLVVQGVFDNSSFRTDPLGRLRRTVAYVLTSTYGASSEVHEIAALINKVHGKISGVTSEGMSYSADDARLKKWVHCSLTESLLCAWQVFGPRPLSAEEADRFVDEQSRLVSLLGVEGPRTVAELDAAMASYRDELADSSATREAVRFLIKPPVPLRLRLPYSMVARGAVVLLPPGCSHVLEIPPAGAVGRMAALAAGRLFCAGWRKLLPTNAIVKAATARAAAQVTAQRAPGEWA